jgi:hypothetical protein
MNGWKQMVSWTSFVFRSRKKLLSGFHRPGRGALITNCNGEADLRLVSMINQALDALVCAAMNQTTEI